MSPLAIALLASTLTAALPTNSTTDELVKRKACSGASCVRYYKDGGCTEGLELGNYVPTCNSNCFRYNSFNSLSVSGGAFFQGTDCHIFSDENCQNQITDTGNVVGTKCAESLNGAKSMICYFNC